MTTASNSTAPGAVIRTENADGSIHYRLPGRKDLRARLAGGVAVFLVLLVPLLVPLFFVPREQLAPVLVGAVLVVGVAIAIGGWFLFTQLRPLLAPREILVCRDGLIVTPRLGPLRWRARRSLALIDSLVIRSDATREADLLVLSRGEAPLRLVQPLPLEPLRSFARDLAEQLTRLDPGEGGAVEVREERAGLPQSAGQPAGSRIIVVEREGSLVITVPPAGLRSWGMVLLLGAGIAYLIGSLVATVRFVLLGPIKGTTIVAVVDLVGEMTNLVFNWLLGAFWVGYAVHCCTRRIVLTVSRHELHIELVSVFRDRRWHWSRQELAGISGEAKGLCIRPGQGKPTVIRWVGSGDSQKEYRWLADLLWQRLQAADEPFGAGARDGTLAVGEEEP